MRREIETIATLERELATGSLENVVIQGLDLHDHESALRSVPVTGSVFLGCGLSADAAKSMTDRGGLLFPRLPDLPYHPYRGSLYSVDELLEGYRRGSPESYNDCVDQRIYRHFKSSKEPVPVVEALAQRLHDHAIDDSLRDLLYADPRPPVVAIMGGHAMRRNQAEYRKVARIARQLKQKMPSVLLASGGGPGAMEACHLGVWMSRRSSAELDAAFRTLEPAPDYRHPEWLDTAFAVREEFDDPASSLGIPTWFYGHEPPNLFATSIAKYFSNSLREDGLLAIATHGVIYAPGSAGTIQEVFMDAAQNHYGTFDVISPMVFLGKDFWLRQRPVVPLLESLAGDRKYASRIAVCDTADEVVDFLLAHPPVPFSDESASLVS